MKKIALWLLVLGVLLPGCGARTEILMEVQTEETTLPTIMAAAETAAAPSEGAIDFVLNNSSEKFHRPDCGSVGQIKDTHRQDFHGSRQTLLELGYAPCKRCKP